MNWLNSLEQLRAGNQRFMTQNLINEYHSEEYLSEFAKGQDPHTIVISCADSRVSPDLIFDQKLGDLFIIQNAGNIINETVIGSVEYAVLNLHVPLVLVLGHSKCGAVTAALSKQEFAGSLQGIVETIREGITSDMEVEKAVIANASAMASSLRKSLKDQNIQVKVLVGYEVIDTGEVTIFDE